MNQSQGCRCLRTCHELDWVDEFWKVALRLRIKKSVEFYGQRSYLNGSVRSLTSHYLWPVRACCAPIFEQWQLRGIYMSTMMMMMMVVMIPWPVCRINFGLLTTKPASTQYPQYPVHKKYTANGFTAFRWRMREEVQDDGDDGAEESQQKIRRITTRRKRRRKMLGQAKSSIARFRSSNVISNVLLPLPLLWPDVVDDVATSATLELLPGLRREGDGDVQVRERESYRERARGYKHKAKKPFCC